MTNLQKKKILIIPSWYPEINNRVKGNNFREQALLFEEDFDVFIISVSPRKKSLLKVLFSWFRKKFEYYEIPQPPKGIGIKYLQIKMPGFFSFISAYAEFCENINHKLMCKFVYLSLKKIIGEKKWSPDFMHARSTVQGGIVANYLSDKFNIPFIISEHQVFLLHSYSEFLRDLIAYAMHRAKYVLAVSEHQKRQILLNKMVCNPVVVGNMIDDDLFTIKNYKKDVFNILVITYPHYIKDNATLFKAIKILMTNQVRDFKVSIIGGDNERTELINHENPLYKQAESYGVLEFVEILNQVEREKLPEIINKSDLLVSTSIAETFGIACCEAMMCGVPVIATANGGIDDIINDKNGVLIPIKDYKALAKAIMQIKNKEIDFDPEEIRNSVVNKYGKIAFKNRLSSIYNNL
ncbi:MAG TPA: glycosyltransferase [Bacteroidales bacterium]|nr:glycosyltransferase [Bacteroidales bacterium]